MQRYHFNVYDGVASIDNEGTELVSIDEARRHALELAGELLKEEARQRRFGDDWRVEVTDHRGLILFRMDITVAETAASLQRNGPPECR
ncbi:hypothetical protein LGH83_08475 [Lichenihabitans sp. PAMC28606]|uniref:DUF6894 family protein n=1 Tax=Lichenihabitans sp. PAMC28606 TaxID=2880932 RepID=UPI001D0BDE51|nr:hypothetical protein [Lichenihabitans sp. PAMC28606]UDL96199.1 hypothetical protein LGH83_08475 [Lichenihabitans sp. PAMC28606]